MKGLELGTLQNWWVWILAWRLESIWVTQQLSDLTMRPYKVQGPWQMGECMSLGGRGAVREGVVSLIWLTAGLWELWFSRQIWFPPKSQTSTFYKSGIFQFWSVAINSKLEKCIVRAKPNILRPELTQRSLIVPPDLKQWTANVALGTQGRLGISFSEHRSCSQTSLWFLPELQATQHTKSVDFEGGSPRSPPCSPHYVFPSLSGEPRDVGSHMEVLFFFWHNSVPSQYSKLSEIAWCVSSILKLSCCFCLFIYLSVLTAIMKSKCWH